MKNEFSLFNLRFIIPSVITIITALAYVVISYEAGLFNQSESKLIIYIAGFSDGHGDFGLSLLGIVGSYILILVIGFVVSSIARIFINKYDWNITTFGAKTNDHKYIRYNAKEIYTWVHLMMGDKGINIETRKYVEERLAKRWDMFLIGFNSMIGMTIVFIICLIFSLLKCNIYSTWYIFIAIIIFFLIFYYNAKEAWYSHDLLKRIMVKISEGKINNEDYQSYEQFETKVMEELK